MKRKDYNTIAEVFREKLNPRYYDQDIVRTACLADIARLLSDVFAEDNIRFNRKRFIDECGF